MVSNAEAAAMRLAIQLSALGLGTTSPNPPVGCVVLDRQGAIAGTGYHRRKGEPHAETHALAAAGAKAKGGTAAVTLEPCNHIGLTPACHQALLDAGIERVLIALIDPTSREEGGAAKLRAAGVDVVLDVLADDARKVLGPWLDALRRGRPTVTVTNDPEILPRCRSGYDAVMLADGTVQEGQPHSHGTGFQRLPTDPVQGSPHEILADLYQRGVRSALLLADRLGTQEFAAANCLDRIELRISETESPNWTIPPGFELVHVSKESAPTILRLAYERISE